MSHTHLEELRGILLSERDSGTLVQIPHDLYQTTAALVRTLQQEVIIMDDPFSEEAQFLIEKVASIRTTAEELFQIRSEKIVALAQSQAHGSTIDRDDLRILIPAELEMFNRIVDGIRTCRYTLIEWRIGTSRNQAYTRMESQERQISNLPEISAPVQQVTDEGVPILAGDRTGDDLVPDDEPCDDEKRACEPEGVWDFPDDEDEEPFPYSLVRVLIRKA